MFEMQYSDIDMNYVLAARHLHLSSFFCTALCGHRS